MNTRICPCGKPARERSSKTGPDPEVCAECKKEKKRALNREIKRRSRQRVDLPTAPAWLTLPMVHVFVAAYVRETVPPFGMSVAVMVYRDGAWEDHLFRHPRTTRALSSLQCVIDALSVLRQGDKILGGVVLHLAEDYQIAAIRKTWKFKKHLEEVESIYRLSSSIPRLQVSQIGWHSDRWVHEAQGRSLTLARSVGPQEQSGATP